MSVLVGALLDVSGSMQGSIRDGVDEEGGTWVHSIFRVVDDLVQYDVSESNKIFVVAVGANYSPNTFDIITTITKSTEPASDETIERIFRILEENGAHTIRKWADRNTVKSVVLEFKAQVVLEKLLTDERFLRKFVNEYLPAACRSWGSIPGTSTVQSLFTSVVTPFRTASTEEIEQVMARALPEHTSDQNIANVLLTRITVESVKNVKEVSNVLHGRIKRRDLTKARVRELLQLVEPFIYGRTPLYFALNEAADLFYRIGNSFLNHQKLLFILSDGNPTDEGESDSIKSSFEHENVTVVSCFISESSHVKPRKLHSVPEQDWEEGAKFLFDLSSYIPTSTVTRAIFIKNNWEIDITNNETRLFMHVNHPNNLKDVCKLARNAVCSQDSLSELLVSVSLDIYINDKNRSVEVYDQGDVGTCYAHASATVLHLAMHRILGRNRGYPTFEDLRDEMIRRHGIEGANTLQVLREICPKYRLRCREVDINGAMQAITEKRPVVVKFRLTKREWVIFKDYFRLTPNGILTEQDLYIRERSHDRRFGHAVVLTSFNSECLHLMNSWGDSWADIGFFRVKNADVLKMEFIDVYWEEMDLSQSEKDYYNQNGTTVADSLMRSLTALKMATFTCPRCNRESNVDDFSGTLTRVCCPRCENGFSSSDGDGNLLALNIYLTSLSK